MRSSLHRFASAIPTLCCLFLSFPASGQTGLPSPASIRPPPDLATPILIDLQDDLSPEARETLRKTLGIDWRINNADNPAEAIYRVAGDTSELERLRARLLGDARVEVVELEAVYEASAVPNDPLYRYQWHLDAVGVPASRAISLGTGVTVAVVDTGVTARDAGLFRRVEDLLEQSFVKGYDFIDDDRDPNDDHGHGTHVAATVAEATHNGVGAAGVAPGASIMPLKVLDGRGIGRTADIADAIRYAVDHGAQVVNLSLGGGMPSEILENAVEYALDHGVTVVAAAGNSGRATVQYPAAYPGVIAVAASRFDGQLAGYSCRGSRVDVTAPGGDLTVDQNGDGRPDGVLQNTIERGDPGRSAYLAFQGTSMASPHVAGAAALLYALGVNRPEAVREALRSTATPVGGPGAADAGAGLMRADAAVRQVVLWNGLWTTGIALLLARWFRRFAGRKLRGSEPALGLPHLLGILVGGTGLFLLPWAGVSLGPLTPFLGFGFPRWYIPLFGVDSFTGALFFSAVVPVGLVVLTYPSRWMNRFAGGFALGVGASLGATAIRGMDLPGLPGWPIEKGWLLVNLLFCLFAAYLAVRMPRRT